MGVRDLPPLRQHIDVITPNGRHYRWGEDEPDPANVPSGLRHSSTMPGGYESLDVTLPRKPGVDYSDLERLSTIRVIGAGGDVAGEYRLERTPRVSGDQMSISPSAVGWQAHLDDDKSARMIYVDRLVTNWTEAPYARLVQIAAGGQPQGKIPASSGSGGLTWEPPVESLPDEEVSELHYDAGAGLTVTSFGYQGARTGAFTGFEVPTIWVASDDAFSSGFASTALTLDDTARWTSVTARRYAMLRAYVSAGPVTPAAGHLQRYSKVAVFGSHGLTLRDASGEPGGGVYASDVASHAVSRWAPLLVVTAESVQASNFGIPHLTFPEATTASEIVRQATRFGLQDWAVWDDKTFWWHERGAFGRKWRARISPAQLEETGPQIDRVWESVIVSYQDVDGSTRTVGPPGSGSDTEDAVLHDDDPENPANKLGIIRRDLLQMGVTTAAGATEIGRRFLEEQKVLDTSGRAQLVGHVEDDRGILHPYWRVRAGDTISFVDAADTSARRIVRADHDRSSRTCTIDLDAPPEGLAALLERLGVVLVPLGF